MKIYAAYDVSNQETPILEPTVFVGYLKANLKA